MKGLIAAHSGTRYIILLLLIIAIVNALLNLKSNKYSKKDKLINLFSMIFLHLQLVVGLILYVMNITMEKGAKVKHSAEMFTEPTLRFYTIEHFLLMVIAIILVTIGRRKAEKLENPAQKHRSILVYFGIGLIIIFAAIPWPFLYNVGAGYF